MTRTITTSVFLVGLLTAVPVVAGTPVGWRNDGTGRFPAATPPSEWSKEKNILWKIALPGASYGAPIVVGEHLFVVSDPAELLCVRRSDGKVLWRKANSDVKAPAPERGGGRFGDPGRGGRGGRGGMGGRGGGAGNTAATPVSDGKHVAAVFGNGVVVLYDSDGKRLWGKFVEAPRLGFGHAASPVLLDGKLIVHLKDLVALEAATGKELWRVALPASHASPVPARLGTEAVVISPAGAIVRGSDGKVLVKGKFRTTQSSPVLAGDVLIASSREGMEALRLSHSGGEVTLTSLWKRDGSGERHHLPSPLVHDGLLYGATTSGFLEVVDVKSGQRVYRQRLGVGQVYSSVTLAGEWLYVLDLRGKAVVFKPGRSFERVALNDLEGTGACPVFAGDHLYLRGRQNLYCVSSKEGAAKSKSGE
jgi:outer membrane protein assembly factor BamB